MTPLQAIITAAVGSEGPMPLDRYMALCLSHPVHGYYATRDPFGARGDFITAPEISQVFGELIGLWAAEVWRMMGSPPRVALVELGPGRGTLMADMARVAAKAAPGFLDAVEIVLVETSAALTRVQAKTLEPFATERPPHPYLLPQAGEGGLGGAAWSPPLPLAGEGKGEGLSSVGTPIRWSATVEEALRTDRLPTIVIANEFFDALPVRQFVRAAAGWRERLVGLSDDGVLAFGLSPEPPADVRLHDAPEGAVREICPQALAITARIAAHVAAYGGAMLAIDYGCASGHGDTLQAMKAHRFADPLTDPGEADLTAHVDFGALAAAAAHGGASVMRLVSQADLLDRLGLQTRAKALARARPDRRADIEAQAERLTDRTPRGMGALFKAFAFADPRLGAPPGFEPMQEGPRP